MEDKVERGREERIPEKRRPFPPIIQTQTNSPSEERKFFSYSPLPFHPLCMQQHLQAQAPTTVIPRIMVMMTVPTPSPVVVLLFKCCLHKHVLSDFLLQFTESLSNRRLTQQTHNSTLWEAVSAALLASPDSTICWAFPFFLPFLFQQNTPMWNRLGFRDNFPFKIGRLQRAGVPFP